MLFFNYESGLNTIFHFIWIAHIHVCQISFCNYWKIPCVFWDWPRTTISRILAFFEKQCLFYNL